MTCCWRCWTPTASTAQTDQQSPGPRLTESLPSPPQTSTAAAAAVEGAPLQLVLVQAHEPAAMRAQSESLQVQESCSMEGPALTAPTSYETETKETSEGYKSFLLMMCVVQKERSSGNRWIKVVFEFIS